jgi:hypothetical protein
MGSWVLRARGSLPGGHADMRHSRRPGTGQAGLHQRCLPTKGRLSACRFSPECSGFLLLLKLVLMLPGLLL